MKRNPFPPGPLKQELTRVRRFWFKVMREPLPRDLDFPEEFATYLEILLEHAETILRETIKMLRSKEPYDRNALAGELDWVALQIQNSRSVGHLVRHIEEHIENK